MDTITALNKEKNITLVLITHHMEEAARADRVVVLHKGSVALDGTPKEVFSQVDKLHEMGLASPDPVELCYDLNRCGFTLPLNTLEVEACAQAIFDALQREKGEARWAY
jgi:energy-coupling factor transport system ATP-binding protein